MSLPLATMFKPSFILNKLENMVVNNNNVKESSSTSYSIKLHLFDGKIFNY